MPQPRRVGMQGKWGALDGATRRVPYHGSLTREGITSDGEKGCAALRLAGCGGMCQDCWRKGNGPD